MSISDVIKILQQNVDAMQKVIEMLREEQEGAKTDDSRRNVSHAGRKRIAAAQRRRWAKYRATKK
jgi:hypothetical protein